jgi:hypothetical protein
VPSLEQIIRPFVVDPTTPPVPYVTTLNEPPPDLVRLNIGIGRTQLSDLSSNVAPIVPPPPSPLPPTITPAKPKITMETRSSSYSHSYQWYHDQKIKEDPFAQDNPPFGIGIGF